MNVLSPRQRTVVEKCFGGALLQRDIGKQVGVSQMQVSRILEQSITAKRTHLQAPAPGSVAA